MLTPTWASNGQQPQACLLYTRRDTASPSNREEGPGLLSYPLHAPLLLIGPFRPTPLAGPVSWPVHGQRLAIY
jgi:hypothetical protein